MAWIRADDDGQDDHAARPFVDAEVGLYLVLIAFGALCLGLAFHFLTRG